MNLITEVTLGVDLSAGLGVAAATGLRFFRPATAGAFGGTAALGKLIGLDQPPMVNAFSIAHGQVCGTMQAHTEAWRPSPPARSAAPSAFSHGP